MIPYFSSVGYKCPSTTNPADFALDVVSVDLCEEKSEAVSREKVENLIRQFSVIQQSKEVTVVVEAETKELGLGGSKEKELTPMYIATPILVRRGLLCFKRRPDLAAPRIIQVVGTSICITLFSAPLKTDYISLQNRLGAIQQSLACEFLIPRDVD